MSYLDFYRFQAQARGVKDLNDVIRVAEHHRWLYERLVAPWLPHDTEAVVADLACGHGSFLHWLKTKGFSRLTGVDSSPEQVALARLTGVNVELMDVMQWLDQQVPQTYDGLFALDFIEHITKDDMMRFLQGAQRALKRQGCLILRYPNGDSPFVGLNLFNDITHVWTYTTDCMRCLTAMHGFSRVDFKDEGIEAIRDHRWIKVPIARACERLTRLWLRMLTRDRVVKHWNSNLWACLRR